MTTVGTSQTRARRGRVLFVQCAELCRAVSPRIDTESENAADVFHALGMIAQATARAPIQAVILPAEQVADQLNAAVSSFRRLDPSIQLVLWCGEGVREQVAKDAIDAGFDQVLIGAEVEGLLSDVLRAPDALTGILRPEPVGADAPVIETTVRVPSGGTETPPRTSVPAEAMRDEAALPSPPDSLGDVDLVAIILDDPKKLPSLAMAVLRQESGLQEAVHYLCEPDTPGLTVVPVVEVEQSFGWLAAPVEQSKLIPWAKWLARWCRLAREFATLQEKAFRDPLTGAFNRRFIDEKLPLLLEQARDQRRSVAVMVFDIDDLKQYNDRFGHDAGDEVLCETVKLLQSVVRSGDCVCRLGGDEFVVVFADPEGPRTRGASSIETVEQIVHRFRDQVCKLKLPKLGPHAPGPVSVSAGLATYPWDAYDAVALLNRADQRAMESKRRGKNAVTFGEYPCEGFTH